MLLAVSLVSKKLWINSLHAGVLLLLLLLDTVSMVLVRLVMSSMILGLGHGVCLKGTKKRNQRKR